MNFFSKRKLVFIGGIFIVYSTMFAGIFTLLKNPLVFKKQNTWLTTYNIISSSDQDKINQKYHAIVDGLCKKLYMNKPTLAVYSCASKKAEYNAVAFFAKKGPIIALGDSLMKLWTDGWLSDQEIEAGIAHELCHLKYKHLIKASLVNLVIDGPTCLNIGAFLGPNPKDLMKNIFSRKFEKEADLKAIEIIDDPLNLVHFLVKLHCLSEYPSFVILEKNDQDKVHFDANCKATEEKLIKDGASFIAPFIELLRDHPRMSKRIADIKNSKKV